MWSRNSCADARARRRDSSATTSKGSDFERADGATYSAQTEISVPFRSRTRRRSMAPVRDVPLTRSHPCRHNLFIKKFMRFWYQDCSRHVWQLRLEMRIRNPATSGVTRASMVYGSTGSNRAMCAKLAGTVGSLLLAEGWAEPLPTKNPHRPTLLRQRDRVDHQPKRAATHLVRETFPPYFDHIGIRCR